MCDQSDSDFLRGVANEIRGIDVHCEVPTADRLEQLADRLAKRSASGPWAMSPLESVESVGQISTPSEVPAAKQLAERAFEQKWHNDASGFLSMANALDMVLQGPATGRDVLTSVYCLGFADGGIVSDQCNSDARKPPEKPPVRGFTGEPPADQEQPPEKPATAGLAVSPNLEAVIVECERKLRK